MMRLLALALALAGCSGFIDHQAASTTLRVLSSSQTAAQRLGDVELARDAMAGGIVQLAAFAIAYPDEPRFATLHADAVCDYATAFLYDDWEDHTDEATAQRLGAMIDDCIALQSARLPHAWTAATLTADDVPAALAIARARLVRVALDPIAALAQLPELRALLERCATLRPRYHDADAELMLGVLASALHDPAAATWFAKARIDGALMTEVVIAHATGAKPELARVAAADLSRWPERRLANALAVRKARRYLARD